MDVILIRLNFEEAYASMNWREVEDTFKKMKWKYWHTEGKYAPIEDIKKTVFDLFNELIKGVDNVVSFVNGYTFANTGRFEVQIHNDLKVRILFVPDHSESRNRE